MTHRFVVANPGSVAEITQMANTLAGARMLRAYVAPFAPTPSEVAASRLGYLGPVGRILTSQLRRRTVSEDVSRAERYPAARIREVAMVAAGRLGLPASQTVRLVVWRNRGFQTAVNRALRPDDSGLFIPASAALAALEHARRIGVPTWLDCPTAHHRYVARLLTEESRLQPAFADTLPDASLPAAVDRDMNREIALADHLMVFSSFQARTFANEGVAPERMHVLPLGVDTQLFQPTPREKGRILTIGFVGRMEQRKGISYLLSAFDALRPRKARLLIVGRPVASSRPWMREGIEHHPAVPRWNLPNFYAQMDVFVLPSLIEGFGLTALEAMACGVPVVVSENTFGSDLVHDGHDGYVVPIRDVHALVERLRRLADDEDLRASMGINARATAERYTWEVYGRRLLELVTARPRPSIDAARQDLR
jgi:glycosyltransferase involved in cell wall biosynthesis